jgi:hypothetical protein
MNHLRVILISTTLPHGVAASERILVTEVIDVAARTMT